jgi:hypothetical protein
MKAEKMKSFRYDCSGKWFKGNTHIHSAVSDGRLDFKELAELYSKAGYDFLFRTDHWASSDVNVDSEDYPLLWCDGVELDGRDSAGSSYHVVCLGHFDEFEREKGFDAALKKAEAQGAFLILAHPFWMGNSLEDALRWPFNGVEIYNHVCRNLNGKGDGRIFWEHMLKQNIDIVGIAADDSHIDAHPGWNGGWIVVNVPELSEKNILEALKSGNFYSSQGPEFYKIECDGGKVSFETSHVSAARLVGRGSRGLRNIAKDGSFIASGEFEIPEKWDIAFLEIEDFAGKRAWSNNLFMK